MKRGLNEDDENVTEETTNTKDEKYYNDLCKTLWSDNGVNEFVSKSKFDDEHPLLLPTMEHFKRWARPQITRDKKKGIIEGQKFSDKPNTSVSSRLVVIGCKSVYENVDTWQKRLLPTNPIVIQNICERNDMPKYFGESKHLEYLNNDNFSEIYKKIKSDKKRVDYIDDPVSVLTNWEEYKDVQIPIIHLFCLDDDGFSYCLNVHGFFPYLYTDIPSCISEIFKKIESSESSHQSQFLIEKYSEKICEIFAERVESWLENSKKFRDSKIAKKKSDVDGDDIFETTDEKETAVESEIDELLKLTKSFYEKDEIQNGSKNNQKKPFLKSKSIPKRVYKVQIVKRIPLEGAHKDYEYKFKITFTVPSIIPSFRNKIHKDGLKIDLSQITELFETYSGDFNTNSLKTFHFKSKTYDSCVRFENRFLIDTGLHGGCYFDIEQLAPKAIRFINEYKFINNLDRDVYKGSKGVKSRCQIEIDVHYSDLKIFDQDKDKDKFIYNKTIGGARLMSFDIECAGESCRFPDPHKDPILCINVYATKDLNYPTIFSEDESKYDEKNKEKLLNICFSVGTSNNQTKESRKNVLRSYGDPDPSIFTFRTEKDLLLSFSQFMNVFDPDIITGYNTSKFDIPYLVERSKALELQNSFTKCTRLLSQQITSEKRERTHKKNGSVSFTINECCGRLCWDVMTFIMETQKMSSYSLNNVSTVLLEEQKDDLNHHTIPLFYSAGPTGRDVVRMYCSKDAYLALRLFMKQQMWPSRLEDARRKGIRLEQEEGDSTSQKGFPFLVRIANTDGYIIPYAFFDEEKLSRDDIEGAIVQDPDLGLHEDYVLCLFDYMSEYPCQIIGENLCRSTFIPVEYREQMVKKYGKESIIISPTTGHWFIKQEIKEGILPKSEKFLMAARATVKKEMKSYQPGSDLYEVLNVRQTQLKISCNGLYGLTIATHNGICWSEVGESVTDFARLQINRSKEILAKELPNSRVIYGDTDSLYVAMLDFKIDYKWPKERIEAVLREARDKGSKVADIITSKMSKPNVLVLEYVAVSPIMIFAKKKYVLYVVEHIGGKVIKKISGIEAVRRNTCKFTSRVQMSIVKEIIEKMDKKKAIEIAVKETINLARGNVNPSELILSGRLNKIPEGEIDENTVTPAQYIYQRIKMLDPNLCPNIGERIPYVVTVPDGKNKNGHYFTRSIQPSELMGKTPKKMDYRYYFENQFVKPMCFVLSLIDKDIDMKLRKTFNENHFISEQAEISRIDHKIDFVKKIRESMGTTTKTIKNKEDTEESKGTNIETKDELPVVDLTICDEPMFRFGEINADLSTAKTTKLKTFRIGEYFSETTKCAICKTSSPKKIVDPKTQKNGTLYCLCLDCYETAKQKYEMDVNYSPFIKFSEKDKQYISKMTESIIPPKNQYSKNTGDAHPSTNSSSSSTSLPTTTDSSLPESLNITTLKQTEFPNESHDQKAGDIKISQQKPATQPKSKGRRKKAFELRPGESVQKWKWELKPLTFDKTSKENEMEITESITKAKVSKKRSQKKKIDLDQMDSDFFDDEDASFFGTQQSVSHSSKEEKNVVEIDSKIMQLIKADFEAERLEKIKEGSKVWDICKKCMKDKYEESACSNSQCATWFDRSKILNDAIYLGKVIEDLF